MQQILSGEALVFSAKKDSGSEFEFILPEYLPGIARIIKSVACIENSVIRNDGTQAVFDLSLKLGIIYSSDFGGKIKSIYFHETVSVPMGTSFEKDENTVIIPSAFISSVSSRPLSTRKFATSCSYHVSAIALKETTQEMLDEKDSSDICVLKEKYELCRKITLPEVFFDHDAQITLDQSEPGVNEIIFADAVFLGATCNTFESRIDFDGRFMVHILYETSNDSENPSTSSYEIISRPITVKQSIENDRIKEGQNAFIYLDAAFPEPSVSFDPYGENKIISLSLGYSASPIILEKYTAEIITDAFSEQGSTSPVISETTLCSTKSIISNNVNVSETIRGDIRDLSEVSDCLAKILSVSMEISDAKLFAVAKCLVSILGVNSSGELTSFDNIVTLHIPVYSENAVSGDIVPEIILSLSGCSAAIKEGLLTADFDISVNGMITEQKKVGIVTALFPMGDADTTKKNNEIVIYYPSAGDTLWSIAKKYSTNPETIIKTNSLENNSISSKHIILIP